MKETNYMVNLPKKVNFKPIQYSKKTTKHIQN
jgi:hypothetical protein